MPFLPQRSPYRSGSDRLALALVPLNCAAEAILKIHQNLVSQMLLRLGDIGQRMFDVPTPLRAILDAAFVASQLFQSVESLIQSGAIARGAVKNASCTFCGWSRAG